MWRYGVAENVDVEMCRYGDVEVWRCGCGDLEMWRCGEV